LSSFEVHESGAIAHASVNWFAFAYVGADTELDDHFARDFNPGFEDVTKATPEPASWTQMMRGVGGMGAALRTRRRKAVAA